jgi:hypothetical protein
MAPKQIADQGGILRDGEVAPVSTDEATASTGKVGVTVPNSPLRIIRPKSGQTTEGDRYRILYDSYSLPAIDVIVAEGMPEEQFDAYVRLFAAAPVLLAALKRLHERYITLVVSGDCGNWDPSTEPEVQLAREAIAIAEGGH